MRLERVGGWLRLAVDNDGPSLTTQELTHLFEPFYRGMRPVAALLGVRGWGWPLSGRRRQSTGDLLGGEPGGRRADLDGAAGLAISLAV
ncbi:MAG: hypothetical protein ACLRNQ_21900 [Flavonifractor plautii]